MLELIDAPSPRTSARGTSRPRRRGRAGARGPRAHRAEGARRARRACGWRRRCSSGSTPSSRWHAHAEEGEWREAGLVAELAGSAGVDPRGERVALNFLGRLSGIATLTARYVEAVEGTGRAILDTRKTTPGLRALEKEAVRAGGGVNHRSGLYDAILVKENHAALAGGVAVAARLALEARAASGVAGRGRVRDARRGDRGARRRCAAAAARQHGARRAARRGRARRRARRAGGLRRDHARHVRAVAETGVDYISVGALTHSAPALDFSLAAPRVPPTASAAAARRTGRSPRGRGSAKR